MRHMESCQACFGFAATTGRALVTDFTARACCRACIRCNRRWVIVGFDFHQDINRLLMKIVFQMLVVAV